MVTVNKTCVFCGELPAVKTKEHVIPQWLMKMTGDPKRIVNFTSLGPNGGDKREFSFDSFHFPACDSCNNEWSDLEAKAKNVVEKILARGVIKSFEWNVLLDWLDKVRIGIWLGTRFLDKNFLEIDPKFHIAQRVGMKDRSLIIARAAYGERLSFYGSNTLGFRFMPSCFGITINNIALLNASYDFLLSERLGFPYPIDIEAQIDGNSTVKIAAGSEKISLPPLDLHVAACATAIHQVVYKKWNESDFSELWDIPYVKENSMDHSSGLSYPFLELESGEVLTVRDAGDKKWVPKHVFKNNALAGQYLVGFCIDVQSKLWRYWISLIKDQQQHESAVAIENIIQRELIEYRKIIGNMT